MAGFLDGKGLHGRSPWQREFIIVMQVDMALDWTTAQELWVLVKLGVNKGIWRGH